MISLDVVVVCSSASIKFIITESVPSVLYLLHESVDLKNSLLETYVCVVKEFCAYE